MDHIFTARAGKIPGAPSDVSYKMGILFIASHRDRPCFLYRREQQEGGQITKMIPAGIRWVMQRTREWAHRAQRENGSGLPLFQACDSADSKVGWPRIRGGARRRFFSSVLLRTHVLRGVASAADKHFPH